VRSALVIALVAAAETPLRSRLRRFLRGLSCDELQFIASYLGACILESAARSGPPNTPAEAPPREGDFAPRGSEDRQLKMILLMEYLCRSGIRPASIPANAIQR